MQAPPLCVCVSHVCVTQISMLRRSDRTQGFGSVGDIVATVEQAEGVVSALADTAVADVAIAGQCLCWTACQCVPSRRIVLALLSPSPRRHCARAHAPCACVAPLTRRAMCLLCAFTRERWQLTTSQRGERASFFVPASIAPARHASTMA
jgi:hypothetical protein